MNKNIVVLGTFFGDEAKSRVVHSFAPDYEWVVRYSGSSNAGHTLYHNGTKIVRHLLPSADFSSIKNKAFLGSGMVINLEELLTEVQDTEKMFPGSACSIIVDPDAFIITPEHIKEDKEKNAHIGSTGKGVSPAYRDKINRCGVKIKKLINDNAEVIIALKKIGVRFQHALELRNEFFKSNIIFEGSQSILLDPNFGTYPYITSGECGLGGIVNAGFANFMPSKVYGIAKGYSTRVGLGPFPTEIFDKAAENLRTIGAEFGATTGRPRRVGWLDLPAIKYSIEKAGITSLIITKLDILNGFNKVPICHRYEKTPVSGDDFFQAKPLMMEVNGWNNPKDYMQIKEFIHAIEYWTETKVSLISCGVGKSDILGL